ncbi:MAG TPA: sialidase family protein [Acidimicrobiales bacterium]|nr:sialidase family protein [Acidimicrobiales bacterium]
MSELLVCVLAVLAQVSTSPEGRAGFRVRSDVAAGLNADMGWAGAPGENVAVHADEPFRIRFEVETAAEGPFRLQVRRNGGAWEDLEAHDFPHPESKKAKTPRASLVACKAYKDGAATADLLKGSSAPFRPGAGIGLSDRTPPWSGAGGHGEFEWAVVVRRFADGAALNEAEDTFEFRMAAADGKPLAEQGHPVLRLAVRPGHLGGTFVETPGRIGPWQARTGDLYFIMEPAETSNLFMMVKSSDHGRTWREVDGANRPPARDLESVDARLVGDTIHIVHQLTKRVYYHSFRTSDHPDRPDTWAVRSEEVAAVNSVAQAATLAVRSDGRLAAFYVGQARIHAGVRAPGGAWREAAVIDAAVGPQCAVGSADAVHLAYTTTAGAVVYRRLGADGVLTEPQAIATGAGTSRDDYGSVLPLVVLPGDTVVVLYRLPDGAIWERRVVGGAVATPAAKVTDRPVVRNAVDSQQPAADAVADGGLVRLLFVDEAARSVFATHDDGGWRPSSLQVDGILGSWIRGSVFTRPDGVRVYGYVYDAGSDGGAGLNRYAEWILSRP